MRFISLLTTVGILLAGTACGARETPGSEGAPPTKASATTGGTAGPWGVDIAQPDLQPDAVPLAKQLAVFGEAQRPDDRLSFDEETPPDMASGKELFAQSRLLLPEGPVFGEALFGVPTAKGWICPYFVYPDDGTLGEGGPCWYSLRVGIAFSLDGEGSVYKIYGVAANDVLDVTIAARDQRYPVQMGRNAFSLETKTNALCPADIDRLVVRRKGRATSTIELSDVAPPLHRAPFACG